MSNLVSILTDSTFENFLSENNYVVVDFWAEWCGPCRALAPILDEIAKKAEDKFVIGKINVDENSRSTSTYSIKSLPTLVIFKEGKEVGRIVGLMNKNELLESIERYL